MKYSYGDMLKNDLRIDCSKCFGLCCTALYFLASDGFLADKEAGLPCKNVDKGFKCIIHNELRKKGLRGCTSYDCFGAGQKTAQLARPYYCGKRNKE